MKEVPTTTVSTTPGNTLIGSNMDEDYLGVVVVDVSSNSVLEGEQDRSVDANDTQQPSIQGHNQEQVEEDEEDDEGHGDETVMRSESPLLEEFDGFTIVSTSQPVVLPIANIDSNSSASLNEEEVTITTSNSISLSSIDDAIQSTVIPATTSELQQQQQQQQEQQLAEVVEEEMSLITETESDLIENESFITSEKQSDLLSNVAVESEVSHPDHSYRINERINHDDKQQQQKQQEHLLQHSRRDQAEEKRKANQWFTTLLPDHPNFNLYMNTAVIAAFSILWMTFRSACAVSD